MEQRYNEALAALGLNPVGTFQGGALVASAGDIVQDETDDTWYIWDDLASLPKTVPPDSTPDSSGGIGKGKWQVIDANDILRKDLAKTSGAGLVGVSVGSFYPAGTVGSAIQYRTPQMYGIEPSTTNIIGSGLDAMFAAGGDIRFEKPG
ncbi:TPA: hypothetical protein ACF5V2_002316, partial [Enterobacter kobei]